MNRRGFIGTIGCTLLAPMPAGLAQQPAAVRRIGIPQSILLRADEVIQ